MLSHLELCHPMESAFLPFSCKCRIDSIGSIQVQIYDPVSGRIELLVTGIAITSLNGNQAIRKLIEELRSDLHLTHEMVSIHENK